MTFNDNQYWEKRKRRATTKYCIIERRLKTTLFGLHSIGEEVKTKQMKPPFRPRTRPEKELFRKYPPLKEHYVKV